MYAQMALRKWRCASGAVQAELYKRALFFALSHDKIIYPVYCAIFENGVSDMSEPHRYYRTGSDWLGKPPVISGSEIAETASADIIVLGGGHAGTQLAVRGAQLGLSMIVIESQDEEKHRYLGEDIGVWNSKWVIEKGFGPYDTGEVIFEYIKRSAGRVNPDIVASYVKNSGRMFDNMIDIVHQYGDTHGILRYGGGDDGTVIIQCQKDYETGKTRYDYPIELNGFKTWAATVQFMGKITHTPIEPIARRSTITIFQNYGKRCSRDRGVRWDFGTKGIVLTQNAGGDVTGLIAQRLKDGKYIKYIANKAVCVTTGDFSANKDMTWALLTENSEWADRMGMPEHAFRGLSGRDGGGHKMCCWAGGLIEPSPRPTDQNGDCPKSPWGQVPMLWLNAHGRRYTNEAAVTLSLGTTARQPKGILSVITDSQFMKSVCIAGVEHGGPNYGRPCYYDELEDDMSNVLAAGTKGYGVRCCTVVERMTTTVYGSNDLGELLKMLGYEGYALQNALESVKRYNEMCYKKRDTDFGKDPKALIPIDKPPYYACADIHEQRSHAKVGLNTLAGIMTDTRFNVLDVKGNPIKGLYVAGNTLGQRFGISYVTPCAGSSIGSAMTNRFCLAEILAGVWPHELL
jgi:hypothetical protein